MKICSSCGVEKDVEEFGLDKRWNSRRGQCNSCRVEVTAAYQRTEQGRQVSRRKKLKHLYKITPEEYDEMLEAQGGGCGICGATEPGNKGKEYFSVDHDHTCCPGPRACGNCNRGLLCLRCNNSLGWFDTHVDEIASYLQS